MPTNERTRGLYSGDIDSAEDAELSRLGAEFQQKQRRHAELVENQRWSVTELSPPDREEVRSLMRAKQELAEAIADQRAATVVGLRVKAAVLLAYSQYDLDGQLHWTDHDELMGWSIARDLLEGRAAGSSGVWSGRPPQS
jgi:hypothetical protein